MDERGSIPGRGKEGIFFSSPLRPDLLWPHPAAFSMDTGGSFPSGKATVE
jgi:hypothetical protein